MSNVRIFFAGVGTTILLIGTGFGGGLMLARTAMEPVPQNRVTAADRLQPARVILPASTETPPPPAQLATEPAVPIPSPPLEAAQTQVPPPAEVRTEKEKQAERAAQRKAEAEERERRRRYAERKARREAARLKQQRDHQQQDAGPQDRPGVMAFGADETQAGLGGFFGN